MILSPPPGRIFVSPVPSSVTRHSTNDVDGISSTRIKPPLLRNAWRAALVMSSDTINPSRQQRSESIWNVRSTSSIDLDQVEGPHEDAVVIPSVSDAIER